MLYTHPNLYSRCTKTPNMQQYKAASKVLPGPYHDSKIEPYDIPKATWYLYSLLGSVKVSVAASEILTSLDVLSSNPGTDSWNTAPWTSFHFLYILIPISRIRWTKCGCKGISKSSFKCWSNSELVVPDAVCRNLENLRPRVFAFAFWANLRGWVALFALAKVASCTLALQHQAAHTAWLREECILFLHHIFLVKSGRKDGTPWKIKLAWHELHNPISKDTQLLGQGANQVSEQTLVCCHTAFLDAFELCYKLEQVSALCKHLSARPSTVSVCIWCVWCVSMWVSKLIPSYQRKSAEWETKAIPMQLVNCGVIPVEAFGGPPGYARQVKTITQSAARPPEQKRYQGEFLRADKPPVFL